MDVGIALAPGVDAWKTVQRAEQLGFTHAWFYDTQTLCADVFVALTAEIADGWMTFVTVLPTALHEVEEMAAACRAAGRAPASLYKTGFTLGCVLREGEDAASPRARAQAGPLVPVMFHAFLERA